MSNRIVASVLFLSLLAVCVSQAGSDPGLERTKAQNQVNAEQILIRNAQVPTPLRGQVVVIFESGHFVTTNVGQRVSLPKGEKFRAIEGIGAQIEFAVMGSVSGNTIWEIKAR